MAEEVKKAEEAKVEKAGEKRNRVAEFILTEHKFENYLLLFLGIFAIELGAILLTNFLTINEGAWLIGTQVGKTVFAWVLVGLGAVSVILVAIGFYRPSFDEIKNITGLKKKGRPRGKREWEIRERPQNITIQKYGLSQGHISVSLMQHSLL